MMMFTMASSAEDQSSESQTEVEDAKSGELPDFSHSDETKHSTPPESSSRSESVDMEEISFNDLTGVSEVLRLIDDAFVDIPKAFLDADRISFEEECELGLEQFPDEQPQADSTAACLPEESEIPGEQHGPVVTFFEDDFDSSESESPNQQYWCDFPSKKVGEKLNENIHANSHDREEENEEEEEEEEEERIEILSQEEGEDINSITMPPKDRHSLTISVDSEKSNSLLSESSSSCCGTSDAVEEPPEFIAGLSQIMGEFIDNYEDNYIAFMKIEQLKNSELSQLTPSIPKQAFRGHGIDRNDKPHAQIHKRFLLEKPVANEEFSTSDLSDKEKPQISHMRECVNYGKPHVNVKMCKKLLMEYDQDEYEETGSQVLEKLTSAKIRSPRIFDYRRSAKNPQVICPSNDEVSGKSEELSGKEGTAIRGDEMNHLLKSGGKSDNMHYKRLLRSEHDRQVEQTQNKYHFSRFDYQGPRNTKTGMDFQRIKKTTIDMWDSENNNTLITFQRQVDTALLYWNDKRNLIRTAMKEMHAQVSHISKSAHNLQAPSPLVLFDNDDPLELEKEWIWDGDIRTHILQNVDSEEESYNEDNSSQTTSLRKRKARKKAKNRRFMDFCKLLHTQACLSIQKKLEKVIDGPETKLYTYSLPPSKQVGCQQSAGNAGNEKPLRCCADPNHVTECPLCRQNKPCSVNEAPVIMKQKMRSVLSKFEGSDISPYQQDRLFEYFNVIHEFERVRLIQELTSRLGVGPKELKFLNVKKAYYCELLEHLENNTYKTITSQIRQLLDHQKLIMKIKGRRKLELGFGANYSRFPLYSEVANMSNAELKEYVSHPAHPFDGYILVTPKVAQKHSELIEQIVTNLQEIYNKQTSTGFKELEARGFFRGVENVCNFDGWRCCDDFSMAKMDFARVPRNLQECQLKRQLLTLLRSSYMSLEEENENASTSQPGRLLDFLVTPMIQQLVTDLYETYNKQKRSSEVRGPQKGGGNVRGSDGRRINDGDSLAMMNFMKKLGVAGDHRVQDSDHMSDENILAGTELCASTCRGHDTSNLYSSYNNGDRRPIIGSDKKKTQSVSYEPSGTRLFQFTDRKDRPKEKQ